MFFARELHESASKKGSKKSGKARALSAELEYSNVFYERELHVSISKKGSKKSVKDDKRALSINQNDSEVSFN